jgi:hemerythrin-like domain-containing protein
MAERSIQHLLKDHREAETVVAEMEALLAAQKHSPGWDAARREALGRIVRFYEDVVIAHIAKEERVFFPALESYLPQDMGPLAVLRGEHREISANFARLCEVGGLLALGRDDAGLAEEFARLARATVQMTRDHIYKEDRVLFPMVARFLSDERDLYLLEQMEAVGARACPAAPSRST